MPAQDSKVLSYGDVLLRQADQDLLQGPFWLNDQVVAFWFEYLSKELHPNLEQQLLLIPGGLAFLIANSDPAEAALILEPLKVHDKEVVVMALNDNPDVQSAGGGSHWSTLVYDRASSSFRHYDSSPGCNCAVARRLASVMQHCVGAPSSGTGRAVEPVEVAGMPRQQNGYDCGVYVLAVAQWVCQALALDTAGTGPAGGSGRDSVGVGGGGAQKEPGPGPGLGLVHMEGGLATAITPASISQLRRDVLGAIQGLQQQQRQQQQAGRGAS